MFNRYQEDLITLQKYLVGGTEIRPKTYTRKDYICLPFEEVRALFFFPLLHSLTSYT